MASEWSKGYEGRPAECSRDGRKVDAVGVILRLASDVDDKPPPVRLAAVLG